MNTVHTILIEISGQAISFTPAEPMSLMDIYHQFSCRHARPIVTCNGKGTARVGMVPDLDDVIEEIGEFIT